MKCWLQREHKPCVKELNYHVEGSVAEAMPSSSEVKEWRGERVSQATAQGQRQ